MNEQTVQDFRQNHACGDALVGGLKERFGGDYEKFFSDYDQFRFMKTYKRFMHAPPLPVHGLPGGGLLGWHLWAHLEPLDKKPADTSSPAEGFQAIPDRAES